MTPPAISRRRRSSHPCLPLLILTALSFSTSFAQISYPDHCNSIVPDSIPIDLPPSYPPAAFQLSNGHFAGGDYLLGSVPDPTFTLPRSFFFQPRTLTRTQNPSILHISGTLVLRGGGFRIASRRNLTRTRSLFTRFRPRFPRTISPRGKASFDLSGFWSEATGMLCMVGRGHGRSKEGTLLDLTAVFKLNYPNTSTITTSLASGTVEVFDAAGSSNHFNPISLLVYSHKNYNYTQISKVEESCSRVKLHEKALRFAPSSFCSYVQSFLRGRFRLDYARGCVGRHCGPFARSIGFTPSFMTMNQIQCSKDGLLNLYLGFSNISSFGYDNLLEPERALVGEGIWDQTKSRFCLVACRILKSSNPLSQTPISDCTIGFSLWFPVVHTIENRSTIVGRIWSNRDENDSAYFDTISFQSFGSSMETLSGLRYEYTKMDLVSKSCEQEKTRKGGKNRYPDGNSFVDMRFDMTVRDTKGRSAWGHATPLSVDETFYGNSYGLTTAEGPENGSIGMNHNLRNISYKIIYTFRNASLGESTEISAEGVYNTQTGFLCMVGCQSRDSEKHGDVADCGILINIQLPSLDSKDGGHLTGKIRSTRENSDSFFFEPLEISSYELYRTQATESISRMDIEITMVLISLTLSCIFIGLQLFHIKKNPGVLPSISITMLVVLTLCHMIPLVLNFEALFLTNHNRQNVLLWSGGWLEVNEVVVRIITMIAFLLQFRLLQVAWSARSADENKKGFWIAERRTLQWCLPLYVVVGLIAWFVHFRSNGTQHVGSDLVAAHSHSLWDDIISYAGLILDGFLLPQVILNIFLNSKDQALSPSFYVGTTIVRALPHVYDAYRAHHYVARFKSSYIYASPDGDLYSSAWDIIIPCEGVIFAFLIFLQQKFGGTCFLPLKNKQLAEYEMVPVVTL